MGALFYFGGKFIAYCAWCYVCVRLFRQESTDKLCRGVFYGTIRLLLGFFFGILIYFLSSAVITSLPAGLPENVITYLLVYVPVRWVEWSIMAMLILPGAMSLSQRIAGIGRSDRLWRLGGIAISCIADIPLIVSLGGVIPVGRFLC